jgi:hypothetical protein
MESIASSLKKSFANLAEDERISCLYEIVEQHNSDLRNSKFLNLKAPPRLNTRIRIGPYRASCRCGHSNLQHRFFEWNYWECNYCECEGFYE